MQSNLIIALLFIFFYSIGYGQSDTKENILAMLTNSDVFVKKNNEIVEKSKNKRRLTLVLISEPDENQSYYYYTASEDNGVNYVNYLHFRFYPKKGLYLYDLSQAKEIKLN